MIKIYDDKITFYNPGALYGGLTIKDLLTDNFTSKTRNKLIAKAFREIGKIERYGSGINRIINYCKEYGIIKPKFEEHADGFKVTIFKEKLNGGLNGGLNESQNIAFEKIKERPRIKAKELSEILNVPIDTLDKHIKILVTKSLIERKGSKKRVVILLNKISSRLHFSVSLFRSSFHVSVFN